MWPSEVVYSTPLDRPDRVNQVRDAARAIVRAIGGLSALGPSQGLLWRGQADASWRLDSTLFRGFGAKVDDAEDQEAEMIASARRVGMEGAQHLSDLEILGRLRHHGAHTRLIDVTHDPYAALWFAASDGADRDGVVLALDRGQMAQVEEPWNTTYSDIKTTAPAVMPSLLELAPIDTRIAAQRGCFVYVSDPCKTGPSEIGLELPRRWTPEKLEKVCGDVAWSDQNGRPVTKFPSVMAILVPQAVKTFLAPMLERAHGYTRFSMYPDFPGLAQHYGNA